MQSTADLVLLKSSMSMRMAASEVDRNTVMILTTRSLSLIYMFKQTLREEV